MTFTRTPKTAHMRHHEFIDHTADIIIRATGDTLEEAIAELVTAMFGVITDRSEIRVQKLSRLRLPPMI